MARGQYGGLDGAVVVGMRMMLVIYDDDDDDDSCVSWVFTVFFLIGNNCVLYCVACIVPDSMPCEERHHFDPYTYLNELRQHTPSLQVKMTSWDCSCGKRCALEPLGLLTCSL